MSEVYDPVPLCKIVELPTGERVALWMVGYEPFGTLKLAFEFIAAARDTRAAMQSDLDWARAAIAAARA